MEFPPRPKERTRRRGGLQRNFACCLGAPPQTYFPQYGSRYPPQDVEDAVLQRPETVDKGSTSRSAARRAAWSGPASAQSLDSHDQPTTNPDVTLPNQAHAQSRITHTNLRNSVGGNRHLPGLRPRLGPREGPGGRQVTNRHKRHKSHSRIHKCTRDTQI